jgi:hypothetical protein
MLRHSDSGDLPATAAPGLRAFYRQAPSRQHSWTSRPRRTRGPAELEAPQNEPLAPEHLALLRAAAGVVVTRLDLVRPSGHIDLRLGPPSSAGSWAPPDPH